MDLIVIPFSPNSYETAIKRWPLIITGVIDVVHQTCHELSLKINALDRPSRLEQPNLIKKEELQERIAEGTNLIGKVSKLKYDMARDRTMECVRLERFVFICDLFDADQYQRMVDLESMRTTTS